MKSLALCREWRVVNSRTDWASCSASARFWLLRAQSFCEDLFNTMMMIVFYPQHPFGLTVRIALLAVFPSALGALLPVEAVREASLLKSEAVFGGAIIYAGLARWVFDRGVRNYASGNRLLELR